MHNIYTVKNNVEKQQGVALITVLVVLFVLTLLGLAATDSSNFQALMVRNNQFRLESFNVARSEIQDQLINYQRTEDGGLGNTGALLFAIESGSRISTEDGSAAPVGLTVRFERNAIDQNVTLNKVRDCPVENNSIGKFECSLIQLDSDAQVQNTNIQSLQSQRFSFISLP